MRILGMTPLFALCAAIVALVIVVPFGRAFADDCPTEKRKVCVQETIAGHTFTHEANTNECLVAKWSSSAKILHDGDCGSH